MSCLTCLGKGRQCDGMRVVCGPCYREQEIFCSWPVSRSPSDVEAPRVNAFSYNDSRPGTVDSRDDNDRSVQTYSSRLYYFPGLRRSPHLMQLIEDERSQRLLNFDPELQEHFRIIDPGGNVGLVELSIAILTANIEASLGSSEAAMQNYNEAIRRIRLWPNYPNSTEEISPGTLGVAISLANIYELYDLKESGPNFMHLAGLRRLAQQQMSHINAQLLGTTNTVIKSLIYHTAIGSAFSFSDTAKGLPYSYISDLSNLASTLAYRSSPATSYLGIPMRLFDILFQISLVRHEFVSSAPDPGAKSLLRDLQRALESGEGLSVEAQHAGGTPARVQHLEQLVILMRFASLVLLAKTADDSTTRTGIRQLIHHAWPTILAVEITQHHKTIVWPLLVFYFAGEPHERQLIWNRLDRLRSHTNIGKLASILKFLTEIETAQANTDQDLIFAFLLKEDVPSIALF